MRFEPHLVDDVIDEALAAAAGRDGRRFEAAASLLVVGPVGQGGGPSLVDAAIGRRLVGALAGAWSDGWQPADLAGVVARRLGGRARRLVADAIRHEMRRHPADAVPARWREQVEGLAAAADDRTSGAGGAPDPGGAPPGAGGPGNGCGWAVSGPPGERPEKVRLALETLALISTLPAVPKLGPAPGEAGAGPDARQGGGRGAGVGPVGDSRILQRVRNLLAKAESTTFPDEAEALTAKAQELMARHAIDAALLHAEQGTRARVGGRRLAVDDPYAGAKAMLIEAIASANRCRSVWSKGLGYATVFGEDGDLDAVELLYTSLLVQAARAMLAGGPGGRRARPTAGRTRSFRQSFLVAFASRIGARLREAVDAATDDRARERGDLLPVLADRRAAAESACREAFPHVRPTTLSANDWIGWQAGQRAAEKAQLDLHTPVGTRSGD